MSKLPKSIFLAGCLSLFALGLTAVYHYSQADELTKVVNAVCDQMLPCAAKEVSGNKFLIEQNGMKACKSMMTRRLHFEGNAELSNLGLACGREMSRMSCEQFELDIVDRNSACFKFNLAVGE